MEILSMRFLAVSRKWEARIRAKSSGRVVIVEAERPQGLEWRMVQLDGIDVPPEFSIIQEDTPAFEVLERARKDVAAGMIPGVTDRERDQLLGS